VIRRDASTSADATEFEWFRHDTGFKIWRCETREVKLRPKPLNASDRSDRFGRPAGGDNSSSAVSLPSPIQSPSDSGDTLAFANRFKRTQP
jgi:hypothetical protein